MPCGEQKVFGKVANLFARGATRGDKGRMPDVRFPPKLKARISAQPEIALHKMPFAIAARIILMEGLIARESSKPTRKKTK